MSKITALGFVVPVANLEAASRFYCQAFGLEEVFRAEQIAFVGTPDTDTAIGLLLDPANAGKGPQEVGLHTDHSFDLDTSIKDVESAGGSLLMRGEHAVHFAHIADPDGNVLEI
jgi:predicted enzyme related to lactoylglutathione lyase